MESSKDKKRSRNLETICRTCLKKTENAFKVHENMSSLDDIKISNALKFIVPEIYLGATPNPAICGDCKVSLRIAYIFKKRCSESEKMVGSFLKKICSTGKAVLLEDVLNYIQKTNSINSNCPASTSVESDIVTELIDDSSEEDKTVTDNISDEGSKNLTFCEETGLFVDSSGNYFNAHGHPLEKNQIEAEKIYLDKKINKLFEISSVFSLANNETDNEKPHREPPRKSNITDEKADKPNKKPRIMVKPMEKLVDSNIQQSSSPSQIIKSSQKEISKKRNYIEIDVKEMTVGGEVNKVMKVLNNDFLSISCDNVKEQKKQQRKSTNNINNTTSSNSAMGQQQKNEVHSAHAPKKFVKSAIVDNIKHEKIEDDHDYTNNINGIIDILQDDDDDDVNQYVDVPEFVLINQFTAKDLEKLKQQQMINKTETLHSNQTDNVNSNNVIDKVTDANVERDDNVIKGQQVILNYSELFTATVPVRGKKIKSCAVPLCTNTSANSNKHFIEIPSKVKKVRKKWLTIIMASDNDSNQPMYCCEDHFIMDEDCINWWAVKMRNKAPKMKPNVYPHRNLNLRYSNVATYSSIN